MRKKKRRKISPVPLLILAVLIAAVLLYIHLAPSKKRVDPRQYYTDLMREAIASDAEKAAAAGEEPEDADESLLQDGEMAVVLEDHVLARRALWLNETPYLDYEMMRKDFYTRFYWD